MTVLTKRRVDDATPALVLWTWGEALVAVEHHGERQVDRGGEAWWRHAGRDEAVERVRLSTGWHVSLSSGSSQTSRPWVLDSGTGRLLVRVETFGRLVHGTMKWREATTPDDEVVALADSSLRGSPRSHHPFPGGIVSGGIPQCLVAPTRFGDVLVPAGAALWSSHVPGMIAVQWPDPPDVRELLVLREMREGGET